MGEVVKQSIEIKAPIERVWSLIMDPERLGEWVSIHERAFDLPGGGLERGSTFGQRLKLKGVPLKVRWEVVECTPPRRARWAGSAGAGARAAIAYDLSERDDGSTLFDYENTFELPAGQVGKLAARAFNAVSGDREARRSLRQLKELLEDG